LYQGTASQNAEKRGEAPSEPLTVAPRQLQPTKGWCRCTATNLFFSILFSRAEKAKKDLGFSP
jgi:hypothetical protein